MLFKNTKPLKKHTKPLLGDSVDLAALRALAGLHCSVCDQPLRQEDHKGNWGYKRKHTAYICCGIAHCPYCGATAKENCSHLIATRASGNWHLLGLPDVAGATLPQPAPLTPEHILDHSVAQKQVVFGAAYPLLNKIFGFKWYGQPCDKISAQLLVEQILLPDNRQETYTASHSHNAYFFANDPSGIAARLEHALVRDMPDAFVKLASQPIEHAAYLQYAFALEKSERFDVISFVGYSPCGKRLIALSATRGQIWDLSGDTPRRTTEFIVDPGTEYFKYFAAEFSTADDTVRVWRLNQDSRGDQESLRTEVRAVSDGSLQSVESCRAKDMPPLYTLPSSRERSGKIHQDTTLVTVRTNNVRLYRLNEAGRKKGGICIPLRRTVSHLALSPDSETFATGGDNFVCLWNVPQEAVHASLKHSAGDK